MNLVIIFGVIIAVCVLLFFGGKLTDKLSRTARLIALAAGIVAYVVLILTRMAVWELSDALILVIAILAGAYIGDSMRLRPALITFCIVVAVVDFVSSLGGLTAKIIGDYQHGQNLMLLYLSVSVPLVSRQVAPIVGIGDVITLASIYTSMRRIGYSDWIVFLTPTLGLVLAVVVGLLVGGIYALPFVSAATILLLLVKKK